MCAARALSPGLEVSVGRARPSVSAPACAELSTRPPWRGLARGSWHPPARPGGSAGPQTASCQWAQARITGLWHDHGATVTTLLRSHAAMAGVSPRPLRGGSSGLGVSRGRPGPPRRRHSEPKSGCQAEAGPGSDSARRAATPRPGESRSGSSEVHTKLVVFWGSADSESEREAPRPPGVHGPVDHSRSVPVARAA